MQELSAFVGVQILFFARCLTISPSHASLYFIRFCLFSPIFKIALKRHKPHFY
ncbi:hypothetical protein THIOM_003706 [Candidatus Thiomargarita nelsonii]|uniref:Uncharacterized protein n=1 Tax=Candidatus Thiomargarita nelsonii TaxID=1003181 RepID=A0A176RXR7_9GAMM|nr:hypothetical protein THIOM_003706 [Candidatus Thiomargarita nelsonii]